ncbi:alkaline phosphatase-like isoform X1 [Varroa jacobsoni]|uniref:alkaline phosphatase-like isoform X1 n=1 Tax=Varroa jacobsoni TaxID=62625 RepID=UPI000BF2F1CC|nr:alkaline phosphatase-like isoform X1 [Varroa jacobsoni]XP_022685810.1 alkaline phosphatase-like isoform X1 [Varroa jacobsoni]XP_022685811.1 alkaline phosphatase-like isoform X1 [Varroa jacobsoni]
MQPLTNRCLHLRAGLLFASLSILRLVDTQPTQPGFLSADKTYPNYRIEEEDELFWLEDATKTLNEKLGQITNTGVAKNVVFFIGDGMGVSTLTAGRIYKGQRRGASGEEAQLDFEKFPYTGLTKTYAVDKQTTDSAASGTAYLCGVKTNLGVVGVTSKVRRGDCNEAVKRENQVQSILSWAQANGKWTGLVTTDSVTGASPAASYAHSADRLFTNSVPQGCHANDIATQLIHGETGARLRVIYGGGRNDFLPSTVKPKTERMIDGDQLPINAAGDRVDGRNLIEEYLSRHTEDDTRAAFIWTREHLDQVEDPRYAADYVLGLFSPGRMSYALDTLYGNATNSDEPSLSEMTLSAIKMLSKAPRGFVLFIEGANIDAAHHHNLAAHALEEVYQMDKAVRVAAKLLSPKNTLMIVSADHSHPFTLNGYANRGKSIIGAADDGGHSILSYFSGPGNSRKQGASKETEGHRYPSMVNMTSGVHGGEDVPVFAIGPWAHLFVGAVEQSYLPYAIAYSACIGPFSHRCAKHDAPLTTSVNVNYIQDRMFKPTEVPVIGEPPVPHRVNIISPNQIEFSKVLPVSRQAASTAPETTSRPAEAHPPVPATRKPARAQLMQTIEDQPGTATLVQPETVRGELPTERVRAAKAGANRRASADNFRKQFGRKENSLRQQRGKKSSRNPNLVAASEIAVEVMPRFSSALTDSSSHALSRMDDGPVELIDDASIVKRQSVQEKTPITITQAPATSTSISAAATIDKGIAVTSIEPAQAPPDTINDESVTSGMKRRRVVKLYVPRNGKFSNGLEKRSGLLFAAPADN